MQINNLLNKENSSKNNYKNLNYLINNFNI